MDYTYEELKKKKVTELREIAAGIENEALKGFTQLNKDHLLEALCKTLGVDMFEHHVAKSSNKQTIKAKIKDLKTKREEAMASRNSSELKLFRRKIHHLKRALRKAAV